MAPDGDDPPEPEASDTRGYGGPALDDEPADRSEAEGVDDLDAMEEEEDDGVPEDEADDDDDVEAQILRLQDQFQEVKQRRKEARLVSRHPWSAPVASLGRASVCLDAPW